MTGMTLYSEEGAVILKMTDRVSKTVGQIRTRGVAGSVPVSYPEQGSEPFYMVVPVASLGANGKRPVVSISGGVLSWYYAYNTSRPGSYAADCIIYYGYY